MPLPHRSEPTIIPRPSKSLNFNSLTLRKGVSSKRKFLQTP
jgi:hypothetical protein